MQAADVSAHRLHLVNVISQISMRSIEAEVRQQANRPVLDQPQGSATTKDRTTAPLSQGEAREKDGFQECRRTRDGPVNE